mgnify:CR=1 FL=1
MAAINLGSFIPFTPKSNAHLYAVPREITHKINVIKYHQTKANTNN